MAFADGIDRFMRQARRSHAAGNKIMFVGNGGSAAIASHMAIDYCKNGGLRAVAFNDASALTCLANDFGYVQVFAKQIEFHARRDDLLVAISSSGRSPNILHGVEAARSLGCGVATFSGFTESNELRRAGDVNFYLRSTEYGLVEIGHLALCHAMLDLHLGWGGAGDDRLMPLSEPLTPPLSPSAEPASAKREKRRRMRGETI
ncbi:MAG TPA: SIS domain-containing protein [Xanthobacteraceae bacterium]|nr:SIS domain-containing protein [Xanthobacteraceae bacterium]